MNLEPWKYIPCLLQYLVHVGDKMFITAHEKTITWDEKDNMQPQVQQELVASLSTEEGSVVDRWEAL